MNINSRYHVGDDVLEELITACARKREAFDEAEWRSAARGHKVSVFDSMARREQWQVWTSTNGERPIPVSRRPA